MDFCDFKILKKIIKIMGDPLFLDFFHLKYYKFQSRVSQSCEHVLQFHKKKKRFTKIIFLDCDAKCNLYFKVHLSLSIFDLFDVKILKWEKKKQKVLIFHFIF
jgi:hypothetical protein